MHKFMLSRKPNTYTMHLTMAISILIFIGSVSFSQSLQPNYDQEFLPIQSKTLELDLLNANDDPERMYSLIRRGDEQMHTDLVYNTLDAMRKEEPDNAVVLAAYCFAFKIAEGDYAAPGQQVRTFTNLDHDHYSAALLRAYRINPNLWLPYAVEGHSLMTSPYEDRKALYLLKTAVKLAPDISYTHTLLGNAYSVYDTPYQSFKKAAYQYELARHLHPVSAHNADSLFDLYDVRIPNHEKAKEAKQYLLSTVPPNHNFPADFRRRLAKY